MKVWNYDHTLLTWLLVDNDWKDTTLGPHQVLLHGWHKWLVFHFPPACFQCLSSLVMMTLTLVQKLSKQFIIFHNITESKINTKYLWHAFKHNFEKSVLKSPCRNYWLYHWMLSKKTLHNFFFLLFCNNNLCQQPILFILFYIYISRSS